jgi:hypothetical protein
MLVGQIVGGASVPKLCQKGSTSSHQKKKKKKWTNESESQAARTKDDTDRGCRRCLRKRHWVSEHLV